MNDDTYVKITGILGITALGVSYFIFVRQDGSVLLSLASIIGGIIGYTIGRRKSSHKT